jgi:hypothetical protein
MNRITTEYKNYQGEILVKGYHVVDQMENNEAFLNPPPALAELKKLLPEYERALANARSRDKVMVSIKNDIKTVILGLLQELADYVTMVSKGDRTTILISGFNVNPEYGAGNKQPPAIAALEVDISVPGIATIKVKKVTNTIAFIHQYATELPHQHTVWVSEGTSLGTYTFNGLQSDKRYWFRVIALGYYGLRGYSPVVSWVIQ